MVLVMIRDAVPGRRAPRRRPWREQFRDIRSALRQADRLTGTLREHALIRVCRALVAAERDVPGWHVDSHGNGYRVTSAETRVYDRAERTLEMKLGTVVQECIGCFALRPLPEDKAMRAARRRRARTTTARAKKRKPRT